MRTILINTLKLRQLDKDLRNKKERQKELKLRDII